jgi:signal transduction histidine kinase
MTTTLYLAEKLMRSERPKNIGKALELLEELNAEVYYMDKIVSDLQDYARPVDIQLEEIDLVDVIRDIGLSTKIPGTVKVSVPVEGEPLKAIANPLLLRRVLVNLILNAVQAMPKGGKLTISTGDVQGGAAISVQDTGTGIPAESLDRIFNPFFTTKARGQGLGLTVCKRLVEAQGGEIAVKSEVGKGSTFTVKLRTHLTKDVI